MNPAQPLEERIAEAKRAIFGDHPPSRERPSYARPLLEWSERAVWETWAGPELALQSRSLISLSILAALGRLDQLEIHVKAALRIGWTADELGHVAAHVAIYAGAPAAATIISILSRIVTSEADEKSSMGEGH